MEGDAFGSALLAAGVPAAMAKEWTVDPQVNLPGGGKGSLFDSLEDLDAGACIDKAKALAAANS